MSDTESEYSEYSDIESVYSEFSDTFHEDIDAKNVLKQIDDINNIYFDTRNVKHIDDALEICVFIEMNKFFTKEEFGNVVDNGYVEDIIYKYYSMVKRLYNMSFSIKRLKGEALNDNDIDFVNEFFKL